MRINRRAFYGALQILNKVADAKSAMKILSCVKLESHDGQLTLTATNLEQTIATEIPCEGDIACCLPAKALAQLAKPENAKTAGMLDIELIDPTIAAIQAEGVVVRLMTFPIDDFPSPPADDDLQLLALWPSKPLAESLAYVVPAVSTDTTRPHINCLALLDSRCASTDGHRLAVAGLPTELPEPLLIPTAAAKLLPRLLKDGDSVVLARSEKTLKLRVGSWTLTTNLVQSEFPPIDQVIPAYCDDNPRVVVDAKQLAQAFRRVGSLSNTRGVRVTVNGAIELSSSDPEVGDASVVVEPAENTHEGDDLVLGLNMAYVVDALATMKGDATLRFGGKLDPVRIEDDRGMLSVVMPMRV